MAADTLTDDKVRDLQNLLIEIWDNYAKVIQSPREEMRKCRVSGRLAVTWRLA